MWSSRLWGTPAATRAIRIILDKASAFNGLIGFGRRGEAAGGGLRQGVPVEYVAVAPAVPLPLIRPGGEPSWMKGEGWGGSAQLPSLRAEPTPPIPPSQIRATWLPRTPIYTSCFYPPTSFYLADSARVDWNIRKTLEFIKQLKIYFRPKVCEQSKFWKGQCYSHAYFNAKGDLNAQKPTECILNHAKNNLIVIITIFRGQFLFGYSY